jgi:transcriptional regulator with XRE-family HTH domain
MSSISAGRGNFPGHNMSPARNALSHSKRRHALQHFLRSRRARISPDDVGLRSRGRRNTSGLRREEVAVLAGVSASWYTWLEQGRDIKVSDVVLKAISDALNLDGTDRAHLFLLAGLNPPPVVLSARPEEIDQLSQVVDSLQPMPAYAVDRYWNTICTNEPSRSIFNLQENSHNYIEAFFTEPSAKDCYLHWYEVAVRLVGQFRIQSARFPDDSNFDLIAARLCTISPEFAKIWKQHTTCDSTMDYVELKLPDGGVGRYERLILGLLERYDVRLVLHVPVPRS